MPVQASNNAEAGRQEKPVSDPGRQPLCRSRRTDHQRKDEKHAHDLRAFGDRQRDDGEKAEMNRPGTPSPPQVPAQAGKQQRAQDGERAELIAPNSQQ